MGMTSPCAASCLSPPPSHLNKTLADFTLHAHLLVTNATDLGFLGELYPQESLGSRASKILQLLLHSWNLVASRPRTAVEVAALGRLYPPDCCFLLGPPSPNASSAMRLHAGH